MLRTLFLVCLVMMLAMGCAQGPPTMAEQAMTARSGLMAAGEAEAGALTGRIRTKSASISLSVIEPHKIRQPVEDVVAESGGFVETVSESKGGEVTINARVPADTLDEFLDTVGALGRETSRNVSVRDVTEQYVDLEARLENARALRDRLRALLPEAKTVADIVAIEAQLSRAQSELDSLEARMKALKSRVEMSYVHIRIEKQMVLGPLGYVVKGVVWIVEKLFVWQR